MTTTTPKPPIPVVDEVGGFVSVKRAAIIIGTTETNVRKLVFRRDSKEKIRAVRLEGRVLLIEKASAEYFAMAQHCLDSVPRGTSKKGKDSHTRIVLKN